MGRPQVVPSPHELRMDLCLAGSMEHEYAEQSDRLGGGYLAGL